MPDRMSGYTRRVTDRLELRPGPPLQAFSNELYGVHPFIIANMQTNAIAEMLPPVGYPLVMDIKRVVSDNVQTLLNYAADRHQPYGDAKALAIKAGISPSTVGHLLKCETAAKIDTLHAIAKVYKLEAWQLLIPNLDPSNPPVVPYSDAERALYWRIKSVAQDFALPGGLNDENEAAANSPAPLGAHSDSAQPMHGKAATRTTRKRHKA